MDVPRRRRRRRAGKSRAFCPARTRVVAGLGGAFQRSTASLRRAGGHGWTPWACAEQDRVAQCPIPSFNKRMRIAKPLLLVTTPIGLAVGLYEGWRLAGGLVFIMAALMLVIAAAFGSVIWTIRRERAEEEKKQLESGASQEKQR